MDAIGTFAVDDLGNNDIADVVGVALFFVNENPENGFALAGDASPFVPVAVAGDLLAPPPKENPAKGLGDDDEDAEPPPLLAAFAFAANGDGDGVDIDAALFFCLQFLNKG